MFDKPVYTAAARAPKQEEIFVTFDSTPDDFLGQQMRRTSSFD